MSGRLEPKENYLRKAWQRKTRTSALEWLINFKTMQKLSSKLSKENLRGISERGGSRRPLRSPTLVSIPWLYVLKRFSPKRHHFAKFVIIN